MELQFELELQFEFEFELWLFGDRRQTASVASGGDGVEV